MADLSWEDVGTIDSAQKPLTWEDVGTLNAPPQEPSLPRNLLTAVGRGLGGLLELGSHGALARVPPEFHPKPGEIAAKTNEMVTGGNPYTPQTGPGRFLQNSLAGAIEGAPLAAIGPMGWQAAAARQLANVGSSVGGELGETALPSYPTTGRVIGSVGGGLMGGGLMPRPSSVPSVSQAEQLLTQQGGFYTPSRIAGMSDLNKVQAAQKIIGNTPAQPGILSKLGDFAQDQWGKIPDSVKKYGAQGLGLGGLFTAANHPEQAMQILGQAANTSPALLGLLAPFLMYRGTRQLPQAGAAMNTGLLPMMQQQQ